MKQHRPKLIGLVICLSMVIAVGCPPQEDPNPIAPDGEVEVVLQDYKLAADETWDPDKRYVVRGTLEVPQEITLTIPAGTTVRFGQGALLTVRGILQVGTALEAETATRLVYFTSESIGPAPGDWQGIFFDHTHDLESFVRGAVIEYATIGLDIKTTSPTISECTLRFNGTAVALDGSDASITYNDIVDNEIGISTIGRQTRPRIERNSISKNETGIFCENVQSIIEYNNLNANIFGLRLNVKFSLTADNNWWGYTDADEIGQAIVDSRDPVLTTKQIGTVNYEPFAESRILEAGFPYSALLADL